MKRLRICTRRTASQSRGSCVTASAARISPLTSHLFVNGLPVATMELKNNLTGQTYKHAIEQYKNTRNPRQEPLFRSGHCAAHFALDETQVHFCAELNGRQSVFLPFNKGDKDGGAGNPVNPKGLRASYFWEEILHPDSLTDIIENYACIVTEGRRGRKKVKKPIWPRYHQLGAVRNLLADVRENGVGRRYLIQHSAGSGKSNSIAWLARGLMSVEPDGRRLFDSIIVITDRRVLDRQIDDTIKGFMQIDSNVGHADSARDLGRAAARGDAHNHDHRSEVSVHSERDRRGAQGQELRNHHRRGSFGAGRQHGDRDGQGFWAMPRSPVK